MATLFTIRTTTIIYSYGHWISKPKVHPQLIIGTVLSARELIEFLGKIVLASQFMCVWPKREINKRGIFGGISLLTGWNLLEYFVGAKSDEMNHAPHRSHNNRQRERSNCHPKHSPSQSPAFMDSDNLCLRPKFNHHITHSRPHILQNGPPPDTERGRGTCLTVVPAHHYNCIPSKYHDNYDDDDDDG